MKSGCPMTSVSTDVHPLTPATLKARRRRASGLVPRDLFPLITFEITGEDGGGARGTLIGRMLDPRSIQTDRAEDLGEVGRSRRIVMVTCSVWIDTTSRPSPPPW